MTTRSLFELDRPDYLEFWEVDMAQQTQTQHEKAHDKDLAPGPSAPGSVAKMIAAKAQDNPTAEMLVVWDGYLVVLGKDGSIWASVQKGPLYEPPLAWHRLQSPADLLPPTVEQGPVA